MRVLNLCFESETRPQLESKQRYKKQKKLYCVHIYQNRHSGSPGCTKAKYCSHDCARLPRLRPYADSFAFSAQLRDGRRNLPQLIIGHPDAVSARFTQRQHDHRLLALAVLGICSEGPDALKMIFVCPVVSHMTARDRRQRQGQKWASGKRTLRSLWRTRSQGQSCPCLPGAKSKYQPTPARRGPTASALCSAESSPGRTALRRNLHPRQRNRSHRLRQHANVHLIDRHGRQAQRWRRSPGLPAGVLPFKPGM